jgi:hypothetical protein
MTNTFGAPRTYRSDDRDLPGEDNELTVFQGGNGDWYVSIHKHGERLGPAVRVTTSGAPSGQPGVALAVYRLWRALGGEWADETSGVTCSCNGEGANLEDNGDSPHMPWCPAREMAAGYREPVARDRYEPHDDPITGERTYRLKREERDR